MQHDPLQRMTIPDVLKLIEQQTAGKFLVSDFIPVPCCFPTCNSVTYAFIDGEKVTPLTRIVNVHDYLDYITNRVLPDFSMEVKSALEGLWSSSSVPGSQKSAEQFAVSCQACGIPESLTGILWGVAVWAFGHLLVNGDLASFILFGTMLVLAVLGTYSIDAKRRRALGDKWDAFAAQTSTLPFAAIFSGRQAMPGLGEVGWRLIVGLGVWIALALAHPFLFGARVL